MQEKTKTTAQVLVDCLEAEGVDVMFGIPGEETLDLMFAIRDSHIRFIPVRHEQGAAFSQTPPAAAAAAGGVLFVGRSGGFLRPVRSYLHHLANSSSVHLT